MTRGLQLGLLALTLAACARSTNVPNPRDSDEAAPTEASELSATSCQVLCAVPGGVDECPVGTPCPRLTHDEATAAFDSAEPTIYHGHEAAADCATETK